MLAIKQMKRLLRRCRHSRKDIKIVLEYVRCEGIDWIQLAGDEYSWWALLNMLMNLRIWDFMIT